MYAILLALTLGMALMGAANAAPQPKPACKTNGQGYYGRSSRYDTGNPSVPKCTK